MKIERIEVQVVGPETKRYTWSHDLPEQFQSLTLLRLFTDSGVEGLAAVWNAASYDYDRYTAEALRHLMPVLIDRNPLEREALLHDLRPRVFPQPPGALALIDIALWDLAARLENKPLHRFLGATRDSIASYASTPMFEDIAEYLSVTEHLLDQGFQAIKFHTWCVPEDDLALARAARQRFPDVKFMLDAENNYQYNDALRVARELHDLEFTWLEAPLPDHDLQGYRKLTADAGIPIVPSGNWVRNLSLFKECLDSKVWGVSRTDVVMLDGITSTIEALQLSERAGLHCELMCWGYTLASAPNLHLMLANTKGTYYEQPLPYELFEYGMHQAIRTDANGEVHAPNGPGLGFEPDWPAMNDKTVHRLVCDRSGIR